MCLPEPGRCGCHDSQTHTQQLNCPHQASYRDKFCPGPRLMCMFAASMPQAGWAGSQCYLTTAWVLAIMLHQVCAQCITDCMNRGLEAHPRHVRGSTCAHMCVPLSVPTSNCFDSVLNFQMRRNSVVLLVRGLVTFSKNLPAVSYRAPCVSKHNQAATGFRIVLAKDATYTSGLLPWAAALARGGCTQPGTSSARCSPSQPGSLRCGSHHCSAAVDACPVHDDSGVPLPGD